MFATLLGHDTGQSPPVPKEGDLFKVIQIHGTTFEIRYGYYEEIDRKNVPMEIYPNFRCNPQYTGKGIPFATEMQMPCKYYKGKENINNVCGDCSHYQPCEELMGLCTCPQNQLTSAIKEVVQNE